MLENKVDMFVEAVEKSALELHGDVISRLEGYERLLISANRRLRLLSRGDSDGLWHRHFLDSLTPLLLGVIGHVGCLIDIGSGAGLPGIPIAIAAPELSVTMVESIGKKARFIERTIAELGLENAGVLNIRAEELNPAGAFDFGTARAAGKIAALIPLFSPIIRAGGRVIFYKGASLIREIDSAADVAAANGFSRGTILKTDRDISITGRSIVVYERL